MNYLLAAPLVNWDERFAIAVAVIGVPLCLIVLPIYLLTGGLKSFGLKALEKCFLDVRLHDRLEPGNVCFRYHTYRGFLVWFIQSEHVVIASPQDAERLLGRLLRYNLTWGLISYGMLFIPVIAFGNYVTQKRSLRRQAKALGTTERPPDSPQGDDV